MQNAPSNNTNKPNATAIVAMDGSAHAKRAFDWFASQPISSNTNIILFHAVDPPPPSSSDALHYNYNTRITVEKIYEQYLKFREEAKKMETICMQDCKEKNLNCHWLQVEGSAGPALIKTAMDRKADMLILGSRGQGRLRRTVLGSVSDYVLHHSQIPTIVVPSVEKKK